jgi:ABC-type transport system substrate-binding protein
MATKLQAHSETLFMTIRKTFLLVLFALAGTIWLTAATAQDTKKKPPVEEEEDKPAAKKPPAAKPADKPAEATTDPKKEGEEEEEARPKRAGGNINFADEAKRAPHPRLREILEKLAVQCDTVTSSGGTTWEVSPIKKRFDPNQQTPVEFKILKDGADRRLPRDQVSAVSHYEDRVLKAAKQVLESGLDKPDASGKPLVPRSKLLAVAETLYSGGLNFHSAAKEGRLRTEGWVGLEDEFKKELQQTQIAEVRAMTGESDWPGGEALAAYLRTVYPPTRDLMDAIQAHYIAMAQDLIAKDKHPDARRKLEFFLKKYANAVSPDVEQVHKQLQAKAGQLLSQGKALADAGEASKAFSFIQQAEDTWPQLAGLQEQRGRLLKAFPVLRVGVKQLPTQISPTTALSDVDRAACQLVFDQLFKLRAGPSARDGYECRLGLEIVPSQRGGFTLVLPPDLKWSDGKPFTSEDIKRSREILVDPRSPFCDPFAGEILDIKSDDDYHVNVEFKRGHIDPLSMLTFPLLPAHRLVPTRSPRDPAFGKNPIGTGPYVFKGVEGNEAIFTANPHYKRPHAPDGPAIKEIRLVQYPDFAQAKNALASGVVQILHGLTSEEADQLEGLPGVELLTPTQPRELTTGAFTNSRLWVLIPNHRKPELANLEMRKALSMLIDREKILNEVFRGNQKEKQHRVLNGPFPVGSWAYAPQASDSNPYKPQAGKGFLGEAQRKLGKAPSFSLKYPAGDPLADKACKAIRTQLAAEQVAINLEALPADQIVAELAKDRPTFDLIYWPIDHDNEALDLWPYFAPPTGQGIGRNFMGIEQDTELLSKFRRLQTRRDFKVVQAEMQDLHDLITERKVAFIPLWQLDRPVAVNGKHLRTTRIHPLWLFDDVEDWRLVLGE